MSAKRKEPRKAFRAFFLQELLAMICVTRIISASSRNNKIVLWVVSEAKLVFLYYIKAIPHLDRCGLDTRVVGLAPPASPRANSSSVYLANIANIQHAVHSNKRNSSLRIKKYDPPG